MSRGRTANSATQFGIRPEHITLTEPEKGILRGQIDVMEHLGSDSFAYVQINDMGLFTVRVVGHSELQAGACVGLTFDTGNLHLFDSNARAIL